MWSGLSLLLSAKTDGGDAAGSLSFSAEFPEIQQALEFSAASNLATPKQCSKNADCPDEGHWCGSNTGIDDFSHDDVCHPAPCIKQLSAEHSCPISRGYDESAGEHVGKEACHDGVVAVIDTFNSPGSWTNGWCVRTEHPGADCVWQSKKHKIEHPELPHLYSELYIEANANMIQALETGEFMKVYIRACRSNNGNAGSDVDCEAWPETAALVQRGPITDTFTYTSEDSAYALDQNGHFVQIKVVMSNTGSRRRLGHSHLSTTHSGTHIEELLTARQAGGAHTHLQMGLDESLTGKQHIPHLREIITQPIKVKGKKACCTHSCDTRVRDQRDLDASCQQELFSLTDFGGEFGTHTGCDQANNELAENGGEDCTWISHPQPIKHPHSFENLFVLARVRDAAELESTDFLTVRVRGCVTKSPSSCANWANAIQRPDDISGQWTWITQTEGRVVLAMDQKYVQVGVTLRNSGHHVSGVTYGFRVQQSTGQVVGTWNDDVYETEEHRVKTVTVYAGHSTEDCTDQHQQRERGVCTADLSSETLHSCSCINPASGTFFPAVDHQMSYVLNSQSNCELSAGEVELDVTLPFTEDQIVGGSLTEDTETRLTQALARACGVDLGMINIVPVGETSAMSSRRLEETLTRYSMKVIVVASEMISVATTATKVRDTATFVHTLVEELEKAEITVSKDSLSVCCVTTAVHDPGTTIFPTKAPTPPPTPHAALFTPSPTYFTRPRHHTYLPKILKAEDYTAPGQACAQLFNACGVACETGAHETDHSKKWMRVHHNTLFTRANPHAPKLSSRPTLKDHFCKEDSKSPCGCTCSCMDVGVHPRCVGPHCAPGFDVGDKVAVVGLHFKFANPGMLAGAERQHKFKVAIAALFGLKLADVDVQFNLFLPKQITVLLWVPDVVAKDKALAMSKSPGIAADVVAAAEEYGLQITAPEVGATEIADLTKHHQALVEPTASPTKTPTAATT